MSGGLAYVYDPEDKFATRCNTAMVDLSHVSEPEDAETILALLTRHHQYTQSRVAAEVLDDWQESYPRFVKVFPIDYKRVLQERAAKAAADAGRTVLEGTRIG
jgi:glutamate synthase (NADPH/NADH) large chain